METLAAFQQRLVHAERDHAEKIKLMEEHLETKYREELEFLKKKANKNEEIQRLQLQEDFNSNIDAIRQEYESKIFHLEQNQELAKQEWITENEKLKETHQVALQKTQKDIDTLQETISRLNKQHEDEVRYLEEQLEINAEQFDMERQRLLLVQEELSEQIALKESYLQDVQEEEEDFSKRTQKPSELIKTLKFSLSENPENEMGTMKLAIQELQSQNTMLKEELIFLTNVKTELESDLKHIKEEFSMEREELEFKINELQMTKEEGETCAQKVDLMNTVGNIHVEEHVQILQELKELHKAEMKELETHLISTNKNEKEVIVQEVQDLQNRCKVLCEEKKTIVSEYECTKEILKNIEMELGDRTSEIVMKYNAMKEQAAVSIQKVQDKLMEKDGMIEKLKCLEQTPANSEQKIWSDEEIVPEDKEVPMFVMLDKENKVALEEILIYIEQIRAECKDRGMDTTHITLQKLDIMSLTLEGAIDENKHLRSWIAQLDCLLSCSDQKKNQLAKQGSTSETSPGLMVEMAELQKDHQPTLQGQDVDLKTNKEKLFEARKQICSILVQNFSLKIDEDEDIFILLNHLLSRLEEHQLTCVALNEEKAKLEKDLKAVSDEKNDLKKVIELCEMHVCEILEQHYTVTLGGEDLSVLLNHLLSSIYKEKQIYIMINEEKIKQERDLVTIVEERDDLKRCMETYESKLSDACKNICEMLEKNYSVLIDGENDISVLLNHLLSRVHKEKLILTRQLDEKAVQFAQQNQQVEFRDEKDLQKTNQNVVPANTGNLQGDQNEQADLTGRLLGQEHEDPADEGGAQETDDMKGLQQKLSEKDSIVAHLKEELSYLQVCCCYL